VALNRVRGLELETNSPDRMAVKWFKVRGVKNERVLSSFLMQAHFELQLKCACLECAVTLVALLFLVRYTSFIASLLKENKND